MNEMLIFFEIRGVCSKSIKTEAVFTKKERNVLKMMLMFLQNKPLGI